MIDIWLFVATNMMVYSLIFHTYLEYITKREENNNGSIKDIFFSRSQSRLTKQTATFVFDRSRKNSKWGDLTSSTR